ncbi:MAG: hypothetical protein EB066_10110, partial [Betaproteobacteria bacterium]|nr:hypothetical protein [Betaproteobacteria bacterium]
MMLSKFNHKRMVLWMGVLSLTAALWSAPAVLPMQSAWAQTSGGVRTLPDFTDLVETVGPSVVNIRTIDKLAANPVAGANPNNGGPSDEELQELFRRFFGMPPPGKPGTPGQPRQPNRPQ